MQTEHAEPWRIACGGASRPRRSPGGARCPGGTSPRRPGCPRGSPSLGPPVTTGQGHLKPSKDSAQLGDCEREDRVAEAVQPMGIVHSWASFINSFLLRGIR